MPTPTSSAAWNQMMTYINNTYVTNTATTSTWITNPGTSTGTSYSDQYLQTHYQPSPSTAEMIHSLEKLGHKVLKKQRYAVSRGFPQWRPNSAATLYDPLDQVSATVHFGYALPEAEGEYLMPDGSTLHVDQFGNYEILDQDAKVTYKANRIREFNPYISASDLLESFIKEVGRLDGVNQGEILRLPIEAFINWLILQAAKRDGDSLDGLPSVEAALPRLPPPSPPLPAKPRCVGCGQFMSRAWAATKISFCSQEHWNKYSQKRLAHA